MRRGTLLTEHGQRLVPRAAALLEGARELREPGRAPGGVQEVHVAASQYWVYYLLIDMIRRFHAAYPSIRIRLSARTEQDIEAILLSDPGTALGIAAPYEPSPELDYMHLFSMGWSVVVPRSHRLAGRRQLRLHEVALEPLILFERGSTGRRHIVEAFRAESIVPRIQMEATTTQVIVKMVEAGLGISIVPLLPDGSVIRGLRVAAVPLAASIPSIRSGILTRRGETPSPAARQIIDCLCRDRRLRQWR
jgi:DNA-binding transcriptional LysR family regulator